MPKFDFRSLDDGDTSTDGPIETNEPESKKIRADE